MPKRMQFENNKVLNDLARARDHQIKAVETAQRELDAINKAIHQLTAEEQGGPLPKSLEFANMGITAAATKLLEAHPEGLDTRQLADAMLSRGLHTTAKNFIATLWATLHNSNATNPSRDAVGPGKFRRKNGRWFLNKQGAR